MVNGEERFKVKASCYKAAQLTKLQALGVQVTAVPDSKPAEIELDIPQNAMFFDPSLVSTVGLGPLLSGGAAGAASSDSLRSVLFDIPRSGPNRLNASPNRPKPGASAWSRISARSTPGARGYTGMPAYNRLREAVGLEPKSSFTQVDGGVDGSPADDVTCPKRIR